MRFVSRNRTGRRRVSPSLVLAMIVLLIAAGGTAYAGFVYRNQHLGTGAVDGRVVKDRALNVRELTNAATATLKRSTNFASVQIFFNRVDVPPDTVLRVDVSCPTGNIALAGGGLAGNLGDLTDSYPSDGLTGVQGNTGWSVWIDNPSPTQATVGEAYVSCAPSSVDPSQRGATRGPGSSTVIEDAAKPSQTLPHRRP